MDNPTDKKINSFSQNDLLYQISNTLLKVENPLKILATAVHETIRAMDAFAVSIALYNEAEEKLVIKKIARADGKRHPLSISEFRLGEGVAGLAAQEQKIIIVENTGKSPIFARKNKSNRNSTIVAVPMLIRNELVGVISIGYHELKSFTRQDKEFLTILSTMVGATIRNSQLYDNLNHKVKALSKLFGISSQYSQQMQTTIQKIVENVPELINVEYAHLFFPDSKMENFEMFASGSLDGKSSSNLQRISFNTKSITKKAFFSKRPLTSENIPGNKDFNPYLASQFKAKAIMSIPIIIHHECIGVLNLVNKVGGRFTDEDLKLASIVATRIAGKLENRKLHEKIQQEKELSTSVIENINEGVLVVDKNKNIIVWNQYLETITGLKTNQVIGKPGIEIAKKVGIKNLINVFIEAVKKRSKDFYFETKFLTAENEEIWISLTLSHISNADDDQGNVVVIVRNISKDKELINMKNDLITTATHELRTPLTATKGYLSMLKSGDAGELSKKQTEYINRAYNSTERLVYLVEDLLGALRIDENRTVISKESFNLTELIRDAIDNLRGNTEEKDIKISFDQSHKQIIFADIVKTKHIIENLVDNAIKYTKPHGEVKIAITSDQKNISVSVSDNGIGVPKHFQESIFDRFVRVPNSLSVKAGGTGLGLYIVKNYVEKQGGKIWLESELNKGSKFIFTLPNMKGAK